MSNHKVVVAVSGGFDPCHIGHIRYFKAAKKLGDILMVILNTDEFLMKKKGHVFMPYIERKEIIEAIKYVDIVVPCIDENNTVANSLRKYCPDVFAKGGDRNPNESPLPLDELLACKEINCEVVYGVGGTDKPQSSSWLVNKIKTPPNKIKVNK